MGSSCSSQHGAQASPPVQAASNPPQPTLPEAPASTQSKAPLESNQVALPCDDGPVQPPPEVPRTSATSGVGPNAGSTPAGRPQPVTQPSTISVRSVYNWMPGKPSQGWYSVVARAQHMEKGDVVAIKSFTKRKLGGYLDDVKNEVAVMDRLKGHPNMPQLSGVYEDDRDFHIVTGLYTGGDLFSRIEAMGQLSEGDAARLFRSLAAAVAHCHAQGVLHRGIKPEAFLFARTDEDAAIIAVDLASACFYTEGEVLSEVVGPRHYVAPEVLKRSYGRPADVWSLGAVLYMLLSGRPPFSAPTTLDTFEQILTAPLDLCSSPWPDVSPAARELVRGMLDRDPAKRLTVEQVLEHRWVVEQGAQATHPEGLPEVYVRLVQFAKTNRMRKEALKLLASSLAAHELESMREMLRELEKEGTVSVEDFRYALEQHGMRMSPDESLNVLKGILRSETGFSSTVNVDVNSTPKALHYEEWLAQAAHLSNATQGELLLRTFQHFDKDNSGTISRQELQEALLGLKVDVDAVLKEGDLNNDGVIDFFEFEKMMYKHQDHNVMASVASAAGYNSGPIRRVYLMSVTDQPRLAALVEANAGKEPPAPLEASA